MNDTTAITHSRSNVVFTPTDELTVEIEGVLQAPDTYEIVNNNQIRFDTAPADGAQTTAFLHSEEADYTFEIRATDPQNQAVSDKEFSMFVNRPGIAWVSPQRPLARVVDVSYETPETVNLAAATYNKVGSTYNDVTLSLASGSLDGSGLTFGTPTFNSVTGVVGVMLTGQPTSFENDRDFNITVRAQETGEASYNSERTLTIRVLADPNYYSPS